jgi:hypothetical protein
MKRILLAALAALALAAVGGTVATADSPIVIPPQQQNYGQLGTSWWKWVLAIPASQNPLLDQTGADCAIGQNGGIWYLAGTTGGSVTRSCTIPSRKAIFFPIVNANNDYPCPDPNFPPAPGQSLKDFLTEGAVALIDLTTELEADLDGVNVPDLFSYRGTSNMYSFAGDSSLTAVFDPCITGSDQKAVSDGYWLLLAPLSAGPHTLHFRAKLVFPDGSSFSPEATYNLTVQ